MSNALGQLRLDLIANNKIIPELTKTNEALSDSKGKWTNTSRNTEKVQSKLASTSRQSMASMRQLASSVTYLGTAFVGMGASLQQSDNATVKQVGSLMMMVGGIASAIGSSVQFVSSIGRMVKALNQLRNAQILAQAFSGPMGWGSLLVGAGIIGGTLGLSKLASSSNSKLASSSKSNAPVNIIVSADAQKMGISARRDTYRYQDRNANSGYR